MPLHSGRPARNPRRHSRSLRHVAGTLRIEALEPRRLLDGIALDPSFGQGGLVTTDVPGQSSDSGIAITQADGKILVAGNASQPNSLDHFLLARYNADGTLDSSFGNGGYITTTQGYNWQAYAMAIDPTSGDIVVAGRSRDVRYEPYGAYDATLARYTPDGILDPTFGNNGIVTTSLAPYQSCEAHAVAIDGSGNVYVAGEVLTSSGSSYPHELLLARYSNVGALDTTFGGQRGVITNLGGSNATANALVIDGGDLVVSGSFQPAGQNGTQTLLAEFHSDTGALDTSFNGTGFATAAFNASDIATATAVTIDPTNSNDILIAGWAWDAQGMQDLIMARYTSAGAIDSSFGSAGKVAVIHAGDFRDIANSVAVDGAGNIVVAGSSSPLSNPYNQTRFAAFRFTPSGALDPAFGSGGETTVAFGSSYTRNQASGLTLTSTGQVVLAGEADQILSSYGPAVIMNNLALARLSDKGALDPSFASGGTLLGSFKVGTTNRAQAMALQSDGKIVVAGSAWPAEGRGFAVTRYKADGSLDTTFATGGTAFTNVNGATYPKYSNIAYAVAIDSEQRIVVAGTVNTTYGEEVAVVRYTPQGLPDPSFGNNGIALTPLVTPVYSLDTGSAVAIDGSDNILVGGSVETGQSNQGWNFFLERLTSTGALDQSFGGGTGQVQTDFGGTADHAKAIVLQPDGEIVLAGSSHQNTTGDDFALARYNIDGSLDTGFGDQGKVLTNFSSSQTADGTDDAYGLTIDSQGRLIAAGASDAANFNGYARYGFALARYTDKGALDPNFGSGGKVLTAASPYFDTYGGPVVVTPAGKILVGGVGPTVYYTNRDFLIARYNSDGSLDNTFTAGDQYTPSGVERTDFSSPSGGYQRSDDQIYGMALDHQGKLIAAGGVYNPQTDYDIGLARYVLDSTLLAKAGGPYTMAEGDSLTLAATASGGDGGPLTYSWDINGDGTFGDVTTSGPTLVVPWAELQSLSPPVDDGPATFQVSVRVSDGHGEYVVSNATTLALSNTPPSVSVSRSGVDDVVVRGQTQTFTFTGSDPSYADSKAGFTITVDWGDGSAPQTLSEVGGGETTVQATHVYAASGTYTVQSWATDKDGGQSAPGAFTAVVQTAAMEGGTLVVGGTTGDDTIVLAPADRAGDVSVTINGASAGVFHPTEEIVVYAQAGNDQVSFQDLQGHGPRAYVAVRTAIFGGDGNDTLDARGADASTILVGGAGNDVLYGGPQRNVLIGGLGSDSLIAGNAGDILIDGTTDFDDNLAALNAIMDEWGRTDLDYQARVDQLDGATSGGLNAPYLLNANTVYDDTSVDTLRGGRGQDWLFYQAAGPNADDATERHHGRG